MDKKEHQIPLSVEDQIINLQQINLQISDPKCANDFLNDVSYFRLIKAFSLGLKPRNGNYHNGITFYQIVELYKYNCDFRQLLFPLIERIEVNLRCRIANYFSLKYGVLGYECPENFVDPEYHKEFLDDVEDEIRRNLRSPFVRNFQQNYSDGKIPMYALVELFSFGTLSKFFKNMKNPDKKEIARSFGVGYTYFESWIESFAYVRNICAHYGRLYNAKLAKKPMMYDQYRELGNDRVFCILLCICRLLYKDPCWLEFLESLKVVIANHPSANLNTMGFPDNWMDYLTLKDEIKKDPK